MTSQSSYTSCDVTVFAPNFPFLESKFTKKNHFDGANSVTLFCYPHSFVYHKRSQKILKKFNFLSYTFDKGNDDKSVIFV